MNDNLIRHVITRATANCVAYNTCCVSEMVKDLTRSFFYTRQQC